MYNRRCIVIKSIYFISIFCIMLDIFRLEVVKVYEKFVIVFGVEVYIIFGKVEGIGKK